MRYFICLIFVWAVVHSFPTDPPMSTPSGMMPSILDLLKNRQDRASTLLQALQAAGLADTLQSKDAGPFILFAPVNDAFKLLPDGALAKLIASPNDLKKLLFRHVVKGNLPLNDLKNSDLASLDGGTLKFGVTRNGTDNIVTVDNAKVTSPVKMGMTLMGNNGIILFIDRVLMP